MSRANPAVAGFLRRFYFFGELPPVKIEHLAFNVKDPVLMARWYVEHLGLTVKRRTVDAPYAHFLADDGDTVMLEIYGNPQAPVPDYNTRTPAELHLAFSSRDVTADCRRLHAAGATIVADVHQLGDDTFAMLRDPWGLPLQLVKRGTPMI
ncbi:MAG: VOC family protein [Planctomycetaceae bacterium]